MPKLENDRHERFALEYCIDRNGTQAAIRAGYSPKTANEQAGRLLAKVSIRSRVRELQEEQRERLCVNADWTVLKLIELTERCMQAKPVLAWDKESKQYIETGEYQFDSRGANRALELLGTHFGMFSDKQEPAAVASLVDAIRQAHEQTPEC